MANSAEVTRSENREQVTTNGVEHASPNSDAHKMKMEQVGDKFRINLAGTDATAMAVPLKEKPFVLFAGSKLSKEDDKVADEASDKIEDGEVGEAEQQIREQAKKTHAGAQDVGKIAELFNDFGQDYIYAYDSGIDMRYYGHSFDLNNFGLVYIIPETKKSEMLAMLNDGVDSADSAMRGQFRTNKRMFEFKMGPNDKRGFSVSVKFGDVEQKILFLLGEVEGADRSEDQKGDSVSGDLLNGGAANSDIYDLAGEAVNSDQMQKVT